MNAEVLEQEHWEVQYREGGLPWETGRPSPELKRVLNDYSLRPGRALELGCGTGTNAAYLAQLGYDVTAVDLSPQAIEWGHRRAKRAGVKVDFRTGDITDPDLLAGEDFDFFFDRGCYHAVRLADGPGYLRTVHRATSPGAFGLVLMGNAGEPETSEGPPVMEEWQVRSEWGRGFEIIHLRPFRFDPPTPNDKRYLGWSCLVRRGN